MRSIAAKLAGLLAVLAVASPIRQRTIEHDDSVRQYPLEHHQSPPYTPEHRDLYDHKIDTVGERIQPLPIRNGHGALPLGPRNRARERQNPDIVRPPSTDHGMMENMRWSFADSHTRIEDGGWTRETTVRELPTSREIAGVNMRLGAGVVRELHWHKQAEWAYVLEGHVRITALDPDGGSFIDDLQKGDLWYFPPGFPHSLQGLGPNGTEFLLIFDNGAFSEDSTFLLTDYLAHTPKSSMAQNFRVPPEVFKMIPEKERYIFQGSVPGPIEEEKPPAFKQSQHNFTYRMLDHPPIKATGGVVRIVDSTSFPISTTIAAGHLSINPGAMREAHWHPNADEWSFFTSGRARMTIFGARGNARTFDYTAGDVGIVPANMGHFIENLSDSEPLEVLEIFRSSQYQDFSLFNWMGQVPQRLVKEHLFENHPRAAGEFLRAVENAEKDVIKSRMVFDESHHGEEL